LAPILDGGNHIARSRYPSSKIQAPISVAVILISGIVFVMKLASSLHGFLSLLVVGSMVFLVLSVPQVNDFKNICESIKKNNFHVTCEESSLLRSIFIIVFFLIMILGPFVLSAILSPYIWLGSILGITTGLSLSQLSIIYYVSRWEKRNGIKLEGYQVWVYDEHNRVKVIERGVRKKLDK
jgi:hypothetical protein